MWRGMTWVDKRKFLCFLELYVKHINGPNQDLFCAIVFLITMRTGEPTVVLGNWHSFFCEVCIAIVSFFVYSC